MKVRPTSDRAPPQPGVMSLCEMPGQIWPNHAKSTIHSSKGLEGIRNAQADWTSGIRGDPLQQNVVLIHNVFKLGPDEVLVTQGRSEDHHELVRWFSSSSSPHCGELWVQCASLCPERRRRRGGCQTGSTLAFSHDGFVSGRVATTLPAKWRRWLTPSLGNKRCTHHPNARK